MDETDIRLIQLLMMNSRRPYRELADELDISLQAVHRRIQTMIESGVIKGFTASLSPSYLGVITIDVLGTCRSTSVEEAISDIGRNEFTSYVLLGAGNQVVIAGLLRKHSDLEVYLQYLKDKGSISDIWVGLESFGLAGKQKVEEDAKGNDMTAMEFRILNSLRTDARKQISEIADEVGISAKTVARHLDKMIEERKISLSIRWYPGMTYGVISVLLIHLKEGTDKKTVAMKLSEKYSKRMPFLRSYGNHPDVLGAIAWTPTLVEHNELASELAKEETIETVIPHVLLRKFEFETWVDDLIASRAIDRES